VGKREHGRKGPKEEEKRHESASPRKKDGSFNQDLIEWGKIVKWNVGDGNTYHAKEHKWRRCARFGGAWDLTPIAPKQEGEGRQGGGGEKITGGEKKRKLDYTQFSKIKYTRTVGATYGWGGKRSRGGGKKRDGWVGGGGKNQKSSKGVVGRLFLKCSFNRRREKNQASRLKLGKRRGKWAQERSPRETVSLKERGRLLHTENLEESYRVIKRDGGEKKVTEVCKIG